MARSITAEEKQKYLDNIKHALSSDDANGQYQLYSISLEDTIRTNIHVAVSECVNSVSSNMEAAVNASIDIKSIVLKSISGLITESKSKKKNAQAWLTDTEAIIATTATLAYLCAYSSVHPVNLDIVNKLFLEFQKKITSPDAVDFSTFSEILDTPQMTPWVNEDTFPIFIKNFNSIKGKITAQNLAGDEETEPPKKTDNVEEVPKPVETAVSNKVPTAEQPKPSKTERDTVVPYNLQEFLKQHPNISYDAFKAYLMSNGIDPNSFRPNVKVDPSVNEVHDKTYEEEVKVDDTVAPEQQADPQFVNDSISSEEGDVPKDKAFNAKVEDKEEKVEEKEDTGVADDIIVNPESKIPKTDVPPPGQSKANPRPIITDEDENMYNSGSSRKEQIPPEFMRNEGETYHTQEQVRTPIHFRLPDGFGKPSSAGIWNTPVITDFGYPFLNFSSEAMIHLFKTKDIGDKKRTFKKIKKMLKEANKRYGGIWKAVYGAPLELFKKFANDPGTICVPNYLKVDANDLNENSERVTVTPITYFSVDPSYQKSVDVPREYLENFYDVLDYTKAFKTYVKYSDGLTMQEFYDEVTENGGVSPFYLLIPKQARYSRTNVSTGSLFSALFGGTRCIMLKTIFKGRRGCFLIEANTAKNLFSDIN